MCSSIAGIHIYTHIYICVCVYVEPSHAVEFWDNLNIYISISTSRQVTILRQIHPVNHQWRWYSDVNTYYIHNHYKYQNNNVKSANMLKRICFSLRRDSISLYYDIETTTPTLTWHIFLWLHLELCNNSRFHWKKITLGQRKPIFSFCIDCRFWFSLDCQVVWSAEHNARGVLSISQIARVWISLGDWKICRFNMIFADI